MEGCNSTLFSVYRGAERNKRGRNNTGQEKSGHIIQVPHQCEGGPAFRTKLECNQRVLVAANSMLGRCLVGTSDLQAQRKFGEEDEELLTRSGSSSP